MTKLEWNTNLRLFEYGVDRGVVYPKYGSGIAWPGLVSVTESPSGSDATPYYLDGVKYMHILSSEDFSGSIEALTTPDVVRRHEGVVNVGGGLYVSQQKRSSFGFSYRTKTGSETIDEVGYKIHIVYNLLLLPSDTKYVTKSADNSLESKEWSFETTPEICTGLAPSAHFFVDTSLAEANKVSALEDMLYGTNILDPQLPNLESLILLMTS